MSMAAAISMNSSGTCVALYSGMKFLLCLIAQAYQNRQLMALRESWPFMNTGFLRHRLAKDADLHRFQQDGIADSMREVVISTKLV